MVTPEASAPEATAEFEPSRILAAPALKSGLDQKTVIPQPDDMTNSYAPMHEPAPREGAWGEVGRGDRSW
jgi:hypothetical protein